MDEKLHKKLNDRKEKGTLRSLSSFEGMVDFFSNDYLGLSTVQFDEKVGSFGGTGSRLISGTTDQMLNVEQSLADFFGFEAGIMFNSGYDANLGFFSAVPQRGDTILYDELIHASVRDGIRLSLAHGISFKHNDVSDVKRKIESAKGAVYIAVESLYSMDGDVAPLTEIATLAQQKKAYLIVDEAHACGVYGESGRGLVEQEGIQKVVFAKLVTFGKAYGSHGGLVVGSKELVEFLYNFSRSFIYTTSLPEYVFGRNLALTTSDQIDSQQELLRDRIKYFRSKLDASLLLSDENSPIQILEIGNVARTRMMADEVQELGLAVKPIFSPTVPEGKERLRICIHSFNSEAQIDTLAEAISSIAVK